MKKTGLLFGSFNPIHIGHLILANYVLENSDMQELWFVVSPLNPFKKKKSLLEDYNRLEMVNLAIKLYPKMRACDVEFSMPRPSYTIDTMACLSEKYPSHNFCIIMGEDNLLNLTKWKNHQKLLELHEIIVYPRRIEELKKEAIPVEHKNIRRVDAPIIELSASEIRRMIKEGKNVRPMLPIEVFQYLEGSSFYW